MLLFSDVQEGKVIQVYDFYILEIGPTKTLNPDT